MQSMARVLVVDDAPVTSDFLRQVLSPSYEVFTAGSGREAVELFQQHRPLIALLDYVMPDMDGMTLLNEIRAIDATASVILLADDAMEAVQRQLRELGLTDFLLKGGLSVPAPRATLSSLSQQPGQVPSADNQRGVSVLVVDDETAIRDLLARFLTLRGHRVRTAQDGSEAIQMFKQEPPGLLILDVHMPRMTGSELLRTLRGQGYTGGAITLTVSEDERWLKEMFDLGSVALVGKPVNLERLALVVSVAPAISANLCPAHRRSP